MCKDKSCCVGCDACNGFDDLTVPDGWDMIEGSFEGTSFDDCDMSDDEIDSFLCDGPIEFDEFADWSE